MAEGDKNDDLKRRVRIMNKGHGYAGVFNHDDADDKRNVEEIIIEEWRTSIKAELGVEVGTPLSNINDPPDFFVPINGHQLNVELVQLVEQEHKRRATRGETPFAGQLFLDMQWSKERFISKLQEVIYRKGNKYENVEITIDVLLIHTAETWLTSTAAKGWLAGENIETHPSIRAVFLIFDYEPGVGVDHWPLLSVYGELPQ
ncbi:hypothetical protein [Rhodovulum sulfidophilum]|uniref:hypothetical protein n=1 Tax=Rhodovulum sulfidophilum TaxID=35806 RepID=UPI001F3859DB|nr:hypothetical protein [Rhodovulum sulfidophilum]MCE8441153.1 hypothetical protein [Rhodovulum sulfidophilum]